MVEKLNEILKNRNIPDRKEKIPVKNDKKINNKFKIIKNGSKKNRGFESGR